MELNVQNTTTVDTTTITNFTVDSKSTDGSGNQKETRWNNDNFNKWFGYYKTIPELKKAIDAFGTWVLGKGYTADDNIKPDLDGMTGWGEDTFNSILWNLIVMKKVNGDSYAEVMRNEAGDVVNLKPLDPAAMTTVVNDKGIITKYEQRSKTGSKAKPKEFKPQDILHLVNDRVADEIHGVSVIEAAQWVVDARNEAMQDKRRMLHLSTIRVIEVDEDDTTRLANLKRDYKDAIQNGTVLVVPKGTGTIQDLAPPTSEHIEWIRYLENAFYKAVGIPKLIAGDSEGIPESGGKISYMTYEQIYTREITELEKDLWNQLAIRVTFNRPQSIAKGVSDTANKNTAQTGLQPQDANVGGLNEEGF